jgi:hypothetical protein
MRALVHLRGRDRARSGRVRWGVLVFLALFAVGVVILSHYYVMPALRASLGARQQGDRMGTQAIRATSALLLAIILFILVTGVLLTFRMGRLFFPRKLGPRTRTKYVDAWGESAKRMETPPEDKE